MVNDIINLFNLRLQPTGFFSKLATAPTETLPWQDGDKFLRIPAYLGPDGYEHLTPTTKESGIVSYNILSHTPTQRRNVHTVRVRVLVWLNRQAVQTNFLSRLLSVRNYDGSGQVDRMTVLPVGIVENAKSEFNAFDLSEQQSQFLTDPFRIFYIDLECTVVANCAVTARVSTYC